MQPRLSSTNKVSYNLPAFRYSTRTTNSLSRERSVIRWFLDRKERTRISKGTRERQRTRKGRSFCEIDTGRRWYRANPTRVTYYRAARTKSNLFCCYFQRAAEPLVREEIWEIELSGKHRIGRGVFRYITADVSGYIAITDDGWQSLTRAENRTRAGNLLSALQSDRVIVI